MPKRRPVIPRGDESLSTRERIALALEVLTTYCAVRWAVRGNDLPETVARLRRGADPGATTSPDVETGHNPGVRLAYVVSGILRLLPTDSRCLMRSLVLTRLLARRGLPSSLVIGVSAEPGFAAHAWVEHAGSPLLPAYESAFTRLVEL